MFLRFSFLVALALSLMTGGARAQDYAAASWPNMVRTLVRFNAMDISDQVILDEYAIITECDLYTTFYSNDFKWNQIRKAIRESIQQNVATYLTNYHYDIKMQLDRYDFAAKLFRFTEKSTLRNVNTFVLYSVEGTGCGTADVKHVPRTFRAVLAEPMYMEGLPLSEKDAQALLARMEKDKNDFRIVYARFNLRTVFIEPLLKKAANSGAEKIMVYEQTSAVANSGVRMDVRLDSIAFYEDPQMTRLLYQFQP